MVPCYNKTFGWYDSVNCYYQREDIAPAEGMIGYDEYGTDGLVYHLQCFLEDFSFPDALWIGGGHLRVLPEPPDFEGGQPPTVLTLWIEAVNQLTMTGPQIATAPPQGQGAALVRLPVWFWHEGERSTGPATAGPAGGQTVRAEAALTTIEWDPGDGSQVRCEEWTAWRHGMPVTDPPCGHAYARASRDLPGGVYELTATATWHLQWWINDEWDGELFLPAAATGQLIVEEIQVVTSR